MGTEFWRFEVLAHGSLSTRAPAVRRPRGHSANLPVVDVACAEAIAYGAPAQMLTRGTGPVLIRKRGGIARGFTALSFCFGLRALFQSAV